ncbi:MAG: hypothetical protein V1914_04410 [archaeon]
MFFSSKKGVGLAPETLVKLLLLTAFLLTTVGLILLVQGNLNEQSAKKYSCWLSSSMKASDTFIKGIFPDNCDVIKLDKELDMQGVSILLHDTWWMYGKGGSNMAIATDEIYPAAQFKVSEDIGTEDLLEYLLTHKKGKASSMEASDYNYLQKNAVGSTVCFDSKIKDADLKLKPGQEYHLYFADHTGSIILENSDKLLIMKELKPRSFWGESNTFFCYNPLTEVINEGKILKEVKLFGGGWAVK